MKLDAWRFFVGAVLAGLVAGCAVTADIRTDYAPGTDFSPYKTFSLAKDEILASNPFAEERIRRAIATQLVSKGLRQVESDSALMVYAHVRLRIDRQVQVWNTGGWGYRGMAPGVRPGVYPGTQQVDVNDVPMGTLVVDLVDPANGSLIWRGIAEGTVYPESKPEAAEKRINDVMSELFKGFPPGR